MIDQIERFGGGQLIRAIVAGARSAVTTGEVARERHLPDRVDGAVPTVHVARFGGEGEVARAGLGVGGDREPPLRAGAGELERALFRGEGVRLLHRAQA